MAATLKKWTAVIRARKEQMVLAVVGQSLYRIFNYFVDFVFCPALILWLGIIWGGGVYMVSTLILDLVSVVLYDRVGKDLLGLELGKELRGWIGEKILRSQRKISELSLWGKVFVVLGLSLILNPFQVVVFMRQTHEYRQKMNSADYFIFWTSYLGGNLYWVLLVGGVVGLWKFLV